MTPSLLIFIITSFFIANAYNDGKYIARLKSWKKYYTILGIGFAGLSAYLFLSKYPNQSQSLLENANGLIKLMPIDKDSRDIISPLLQFSKPSQSLQPKYANNNNNNNSNNNNSNNNNSNNNNSNNNNSNNNNSNNSNNNNSNNHKRSVSETKKKYVAAQQGWNCGACKRQLPAWFEVDHIVRLDRGGTNEVNNLIALCRDCHGRKTSTESL